MAVGRENLNLLEEISVLSETSFEQLPALARERLGAKEGQKNLLLRIIIRSIERTLVKEEADEIRNMAYLAVHESEVRMMI
jgi:phenylalanyl-tRNA synthetase alpha chain